MSYAILGSLGSNMCRVIGYATKSATCNPTILAFLGSSVNDFANCFSRSEPTQILFVIILLKR